MNQGISILLIDEDASFIDELQTVLKEDSFDVHSAKDGKSGLELIITNNPDLIVVHAILPDLSGLEVCKIIKSNPATAQSIIVLMSSSGISSDCQSESLDCGFDGFVIKTRQINKMRASLEIFIRNKQYEKALNKSEERFRIAQEMSPDGFTILHPLKNGDGEIVDFTWVYQNQTIAKINGTTPHEVIGKRLLEIFPTHYNTNVFHAYIRAANTGITQIIDEVHVEGVVPRPVCLRLVVVSTGEDIAIFTHDITDRRESEKLLGLSEAKFRAILDASPVPIALNDEKQNISYLNSAFEKTFGYNLKDIPDLSSWWLRAYPDPDYRLWIAETWQARLDKAKLEQNSFEALEVNIQCKDGSIRTVLVDAVSLTGVFQGEHLVSLFDITDRKRAELEIIRAKESADENNANFTAILEGTADSIWAFNRNYQIIYINNSFQKEFHAAFGVWLEKGSNLFHGLPESLRPFWKPRYDRVLANERFAIVDEIETLKGKTYIQVTFNPIVKNGVVIGGSCFGSDITIRKNAEIEIIQAKEKLEKSEQKLKEALEIGKMGSWELDIETGIFTFTDNFYTIFHTSAREMGGYKMKIEDYARLFVHPEDASKVAEETQFAIESSDPEFTKTVEHRIKYYDGGIGYISVRFFIVKNEFGKTIKTYGVNQDITEKKMAEIGFLKAKEEAEQSQKKFKAIADTSPLAIYISKGIRQVAEYINPTFYKLFGYDYNEIAEADLWWKHAYPDLGYQKQVSEEWNSKVEIAIQNKTSIEPMEVVVTCKDGSRKNISWGLVSTGDENWAFGMDLTAFRNTEKELISTIEKAEESEEKIKHQNQEIVFTNERLESLLKVSQLQTNSIQDILDFALNEAVILTKSTIGYIYFYNEEKKQFILNSWSNEVMKECTVLNPQSIYDLDKTGCWGEAVRQRKPIVINNYHEENPLKKGIPEGHIRLDKFLTIPVIFDDKIVAVAGVANKATDYNSSDIRQLTLLMDNVWKITERLILIKDLQSAKERAEESDRLKSAFLANMSHEIRTPMNGILGFSQLLKEKNLTGDEQEMYIGIIEKSGQRMLNIINDIIDISKIEAGMIEIRKSESNINEQIEYVYTFFKPEAEAKGLAFKINNAQINNELTLETDREKLYAILTNLVKNAIKYTDKGEIELGCVHKGDFLEFYVKDTGFGIPKDRQNAIFERFIQADIEDKMAFQGAGLGLAITKAFVEIIGGRIWLESEEGRGSVFYFTLPVETKSETKRDIQYHPADKENTVEKPQLVIMIVEDDNVSEMLLERNLRMYIKKLFKAHTGLEAVEKARNNPDIDLILMDIRLPEMDGYEATRQIRQFNNGVTIIAQTAFGLAGDREKAIESGCDDYISKPIVQEELSNLIHFYLNSGMNQKGKA